MKARTKRIISTIILLSIMAIGVGMILHTFRDNIIFFRTPSEIQSIDIGKRIRLGGMVKEGSVNKQFTNQKMHTLFVITDYQQEISVEYDGILPNLFREGQGVVAYGLVEHACKFKATELLAKHDENYMPPEVKAKINITDKEK
jgi:cytochrome c-type biogenesis protein CcmE